MDQPNAGDLVTYDAVRHGESIQRKCRGLVVVRITSNSGFDGTRYEGVKFNPWPDLDPLFILSEDFEIILWCGTSGSLQIISRVSDAVG